VTEPEEATEDDILDETTVSVVVADDHPMWRDAVARDLTDAGFNVVATADDGHSAVNRTLATRPDVLVLDLNLPGLRGDQVCAAIVKAQIPTKVLILSASDGSGQGSVHPRPGWARPGGVPQAGRRTAAHGRPRGA